LIAPSKAAHVIKRSIIVLALLQQATAFAAVELTSTDGLTSSTTKSVHTPAHKKVRYTPFQQTEPQTAEISLSRPADFDQQIDTLLGITGISAQLPYIHDLVLEARDVHIARCKTRQPDASNGSSYRPDALKSTLTNKLHSSLLPDHLSEFLRWYRGDHGKRVIHSEQKIRSQTSFDNFRKTVALSEARQLHIKEIEFHSSANKLGSIIGVETEYGGIVLSGCIEQESNRQYNNLTQHQPDRSKTDTIYSAGDTATNSTGKNAGNNAAGNNTGREINRERVMAEIIRSDQSLMEQLFYQDTIDGMAFSLQDLSDIEMSHYASFASSPAARHVFSRLVDALQDTLQSSSGTLHSGDVPQSTQRDE